MSLENHGEGRYTIPGQSRDFPSYYSVLEYSDTGVAGRYTVPGQSRDFPSYYGVLGYSDTGVAGRYTVPGWEVLHCAPLKS